MAKEKVFHFSLWSKDEVDVEVPAKNKKEAREKLNEMCNNDEIRWEKAVVVESGIKYNGMTKKEA